MIQSKPQPAETPQVGWPAAFFCIETWRLLVANETDGTFIKDPKGVGKTYHSITVLKAVVLKIRLGYSVFSQRMRRKVKLDMNDLSHLMMTWSDAFSPTGYKKD